MPGSSPRHGPIKDRLRPPRGVQSVRSGQQLLEDFEAVQAIRRGDLWALPGVPPARLRGAAGAQNEVATQHRLAGGLRLAD